jgi:hypothetical protein
VPWHGSYDWPPDPVKSSSRSGGAVGGGPVGAAGEAPFVQPATMTEANKAARWPRHARRDRRCDEARVIAHRGDRMSPDLDAVICADITIVVQTSARQVKGCIEGDVHDESAISFGT